MQYKFAESETQHAARLTGNFHRTRQIRRAIMHILTGHVYSELAWYLVDKGLGELFKMAAVKLDGELLISDGEPSDREFLVAEASMIASSADPDASQRARIEKLSKGLFPGKTPYPYTGSSGYLRIDDQARKMVRSAFEALDPGSYSDVAAQLNDQGYLTAKGKVWTKGASRSFCQNPIHAGYAITYKERRPDGSANKRGGIILTRLTQGMPEPVISLEVWRTCNPIMSEREVVLVTPER